MKKLFLLGACLVASTTFAQQTITFATEPTYPPFETTNEKGNIIGFDVDIAQAICAKIEAKCQFIGQSFDSLIPGLKFKKFDAAIAAINITEPRLKQVSFSEPYYGAYAAYITTDPTMTMDKAKNIAIQNGSTFQHYLNKKYPQYQAKPYASLQNAVLDLQNGRVDLILGDAVVLAEWLKQYQGLHFVGEQFLDPEFFGVGKAIAVNKNNKQLIEQFNKGLAAIKADGQYQQIVDKWMSGKE